MGPGFDDRDESMLFCPSLGGARGGVNFVSLLDPGRGWEDFGTPYGFHKIWCKKGLGGSSLEVPPPAVEAAIPRALPQPYNDSSVNWPG